MHLKPGYVVGGRYEIKAQQAGQPFVSAYLARDMRLGVPVVFKVVHATGPTPKAHAALRERFEADVRAASQLRYPGLLGVLDHGQLESGLLFMVAEWSPGATLEERIAQAGPGAAHEVKALWTGALEALAEAHAQGFVHGALTADRLLVRHAGSRRARMVVQEFAASGRAQGYGPRSTTLVEGRVIANCSPESFTGQREPTPASDVFQAGVLIASQLCGAPVLDVTSIAGMIEAFGAGVETEHGRSLRLPDAIASGPFAKLLAGALALDPGRRLASAEELLEALDTVSVRVTVTEWHASARAHRAAPARPKPAPPPEAEPTRVEPPPVPPSAEATRVEPRPAARRRTLVEALQPSLPPSPAASADPSRRRKLVEAPQPSPPPAASADPSRRRKRPHTIREELPDRVLVDPHVERASERWLKARRAASSERRDDGWPVWTQPGERVKRTGDDGDVSE